VRSFIRNTLFLSMIWLSGASYSSATADDNIHPNNDVVTHISKLVLWDGVIYSLFLILIVFFMLRLVRRLVEDVSDKFARQRLLLQKLETIFQFVVYIGSAVLIFFMSFRVNAQVLAIIGGTLAVAIGFAVKDLVASFLAGIIIMIDRPFQVGDRVRFGGEYGDITAIGLRSVRMQTLTDDTVTIPNNLFLSELTVSGNYGNLHMQVNIPFYVGIDQDVDAARNIVCEAAASSRYIYLPNNIVVLVNQVIQENYMAIRLTLKAYVLDTQYEKAFETDITLRVLYAFADQGIKPPSVLHRSVV
jgi:small-conductance mechanosensitive channel